MWEGHCDNLFGHALSSSHTLLLFYGTEIINTPNTVFLASRTMCQDNDILSAVTVAMLNMARWPFFWHHHVWYGRETTAEAWSGLRLHIAYIHSWHHVVVCRRTRIIWNETHIWPNTRLIWWNTRIGRTLLCAFWMVHFGWWAVGFCLRIPLIRSVFHSSINTNSPSRILTSSLK